MKKVKNKLVKKLLIISLVFSIETNSYAGGVPVIDVAAIAQMAQQYQQLVQLYQQMQTSNNYLGQLNSDSLKWMSPEFSKYFANMKNLRVQIERANEILSTDINQSLEQYNKLYPGYDGYKIRNYTDDFKNRSNSLLKLLSAQIAVANEALANQKDIDTADKSSAAAVANLTLASLSNLNNQISSEIRAANAYRASQIQNETDKRLELQNFIGKPYKRHDPSKYKTCIGEC